MPRYIAFLRSVNVGGRTIKMERLREIFSAQGFQNVETFIASGNVIFETKRKAGPALEKSIEGALRTEFRYEVPTFVRSADEVAAIAAYEPFPKAEAEKAHAIHVSFLRAPLSEEIAAKLVASRTAVDEFHVNGREYYWLCRVSILETQVKWAAMGKTFSQLSTARNMNTVRRLAAKYCS